MTALSPKARDLFARARAEGAPSAVQRVRVLEGVTRAVAAPPPAPTTVPGAKASIGKIVVALAVIGAIGAVTWSSSSGSPSPSPSPSQSESPSLSPSPEPAVLDDAVPTSSTGALADARDPAPSPASGRRTDTQTDTRTDARTDTRTDARTDARTDTRTTTRSPRPATSEEDLSAELALLRTAQRARRAQDFDAALAALDTHASRFPHGTLANERDVTRAAVVCESGDLARGRALAARFATSAWASALERACESSEESTSIDETP